ncbi:MAG: preprotein translocase subunit SecG [Candidatus Azotimanducaceae bacterium]
MDLNIVETLVLVAHVLAALVIICLILIQQGKGADMGAGFGAGGSSTVFGSEGAGNFLTKMTTWIAIGFFMTSFALAYFAKQRSVNVSDFGVPEVLQRQEVPTPLSEVPIVEMENTSIPEL